MPIIDDIINELNGATVFSHLDMNHGYHQLELEENSRDTCRSLQVQETQFWYEIRWGDIPGNCQQRNHSRHSGMHQHQ